MLTLGPCIWLSDDVDDALAFYRRVFPGARMTGELRAGAEGPFPEGTLITATLELDGGVLTLLSGARAAPSEAVSLVVTCDTQDELDRVWNAFASDGEEQMCGWVKDRFGVSWQVLPRVLPSLLSDADREKGMRAMRAMLEMRKLDIAALTRAHAGTT